jgi:hypothetical protein
VLSDGCLTPEEVKEIYKNAGYSVVAYTDHDILIPHHAELSDDEFLALNGWEITFTEPQISPIHGVKRVCHMCIIAKDPDNVKQVCWFHRKHFNKNEDKANLADEPEFKPEYTPESINEAIARAKAAGFFVTYNHPIWSLENRESYLTYEGMDAMEICNYGCIVVGYNDYVPQIYDEMLMSGKRIFCIATDDNHNHGPVGTRKFDSFGGFTMIKAEKLEYETITKALKDGNFYASQGPEIHSLWFEDGKIHVSCSPADRVVLNTGIRRAACEYAENGNLLTEVSFRVNPKDGYVRITVIDEKGYPANTNAYFTDKLFD